MHLTQKLELFPDHAVTQILFRELKNAAELKKSAVEGKINGALINPAMVKLFTRVFIFLYGYLQRKRATFTDPECSCFFIGLPFISSQLVSPFQVLVAANKAVHSQKIGKMKTRSLYSEIIFNLSPTNNISEAFKRFGIADGDESVLVVLVHNKDESHHLADITAQVDGLQVPVDEVSSLSDSAKIRKLYKVTPQEEKCGTLLDAVVCRMAIKDVM
ncbi:EKC/KEOPS complex subunit TPRKB isoform X1 [Echeneis naucrates]|uniref:EKC/KEOPS complex subunit TPRKB isoform X1 n=1 Tax=Echeneis naucrates TaxID=173247 RepID=UPI0011138625|nr:EKC/KEOPS complex subunit TPRKB isoform X1 [Echeneis naucrates]